EGWTPLRWTACSARFRECAMYTICTCGRSPQAGTRSPRTWWWSRPSHCAAGRPPRSMPPRTRCAPTLASPTAPCKSSTTSTSTTSTPANSRPACRVALRGVSRFGAPRVADARSGMNRVLQPRQGEPVLLLHQSGDVARDYLLHLGTDQRHRNLGCELGVDHA